MKQSKNESQRGNSAASPPLTPDDRLLRESCEEAIRTGMPSVEKVVNGTAGINERWVYLSIGESLFTIFQRLLYRETHDSFERYCERCWGMPVANAQRFILMYQTVIMALTKPEVMGYWQKSQ